MRRLALLAAAAAGLVLAPVRGWAAITAPTQTAGTATGTGNITVAVPSSVSGGIVANDVILAICGSRDAATWSTSSSGWSLVKSFAGTASGIGVFYCRDNGSASCGSLAAVKSTGTGNGRCGTYLFRGVDPTTAVDVAATSATTATASPIAVAAVTTVTNGAVVLSAVDDSNTSATTMTCPGTGVTTSAAFAAFGSSTSRGGNGFCWGTFASAGSTGTQSITFSSVTNLTGFLFALRPTGDATASPAGASATAAAGTVSSSCSGGCPISVDGGNAHTNLTNASGPQTVPSYTVPAGGYHIVVVSFATSSQTGNDPAATISGGGVTWSPLTSAHDTANGGGGNFLWYSNVAGGTTISGASISYTGNVDATIDIYSLSNAGPVQPGATKAVRTNGATAIAFSSSPGLTATQTGSMIVGNIQGTNVSTTPAAQSGDAIITGTSRIDSNGPEIFASLYQTSATTASTAYGFGVTNTGDVSWGWTVAAAEIVPPVNATVSPASASATASAGSIPQPDAAASPSGASATAAAGAITTGGGVPSMVQHTSSGYNPAGNGTTGNHYTWWLPEPVGAGNALVLSMWYPVANSITQITQIVGGVSTDWCNGASDCTSKMATSTTGTNLKGAQFVHANASTGFTKMVVAFDSATITFQYTMTEFTNVATSSPVNGTAARTVTGPSATGGATISAGAFTPGNNDALGGNLIVAYAFNDETSFPSYVSGWNHGTGMTLLSAYATGIGGDYAYASESMVQATSASIDPSFTFTVTNTNIAAPNTFHVLALALKAANAGTPPPNRMRIVKTVHYTTGNPSPSVGIQMPGTGNLQVVATSNGDNLFHASSISATAGSWTRLTYDAAAGSDTPQFWYWPSATPDDGLHLTISTSSTATITFLLYDIAGADASPYHGEIAGVSGGSYDGATGMNVLNDYPVITPSYLGMTLSNLGLGTGPSCDLASGSPTGAVYGLVHYDNEVDQDRMENADGKAHYYNSDTSTQHWNWTMCNSLSCGSPGTYGCGTTAFATAVHFSGSLANVDAYPAAGTATASAGAVTSSGTAAATIAGASATASASAVTSGVSATTNPAGSSATASAGTTTSTGTASRSPAAASATSAAGALTSTGTASSAPAAASATTSAGAVTSTGTAVRSPAVASATAAAGATTSTGTSIATVVGASSTASAGVVTSSGASPGSSFPAAASVTASAGVLASSGTAVRSILGAAATAAAGAVSSSGGGGNGTATIAAAAAVALAGSVSAVTSAVASIAGAAAILAAGILPMNGDLSNAPRYELSFPRPKSDASFPRPKSDASFPRPHSDLRM